MARLDTIASAREAALSVNAVELAAWRERMNLAQDGAAIALGVRLITYRSWEQVLRPIPAWVGILTRYIERYGMLKVRGIDSQLLTRRRKNDITATE